MVYLKQPTANVIWFLSQHPPKNIWLWYPDTEMASCLRGQVGCWEVSAFTKVVQVFIPAFRGKLDRQTLLHEPKCVFVPVWKRRGGREKRGHRVWYLLATWAGFCNAVMCQVGLIPLYLVWYWTQTVWIETDSRHDWTAANHKGIPACVKWCHLHGGRHCLNKDLN